MDLFLAGLAFLAFVGLFSAFILGVMRFEEWRQRRGYARIGEELGATPEILGRHARWRLWGVSGTTGGCQFEVRTVVGANATGPSFRRNGGQITNRPLMTKICVRPAAGQTLPRGALVPASKFRGQAPTSLEPNGRVHSSTEPEGRLWAYGEIKLADRAVGDITEALERSRSGLFIEADRVEVWLALPTSRRSAERVTTALGAAVLAANTFGRAG